MIHRILIANRGEIARRIFSTCRRLGIDTVAVYSDPDVGEPHVQEADIGVLLPGKTASETYLNVGAILSAAKDSGADAIHPGYGFLAENADFARAVGEAGLVWIGPSPEAIASMGSKLEAKKLMDEAGVESLPGRDLTGLDKDEIEAAAGDIGYPVLIKASAGGGGKGMRIVADQSELHEAVEGAMREAKSAFGDGTVFVEKYLEKSRHIEIQILGDTNGRLVSLFERECSIQRRYQKIIEESPSPAIDYDLRERMGVAAVTAGKAVNYVGAGTVEFLFQNGEFYFLEMNTRLQVEHPVTEMVTGLDLVELQILVANGEPLPEDALSPRMDGHAVEARLYAEDPANDFLPVTGKIHAFHFSKDLGVRVDSGVDSGSNISVHYDPLVAKVIAHAPTRSEAITTLAGALRGARIHGSTTNRDLLVRILEHPEFKAGSVDTDFLSRNDIAALSAPLASEHDESHAGRAAALADQAFDRSIAGTLPTIPTGWRNIWAASQERTYEGVHSRYEILYSIADDVVNFEGLGDASIVECAPDRVEYDLDGVLHQFDVARYGDIRHVDSPSTPVRLLAVPRFPDARADESAGSLHSPMPGRIIRVAAGEGDHVDDGQVLVVLEAMKMEHSIKSPYAGTVRRVVFAAGDQVEADAVLVVVEPDTNKKD